MNGQGAHRETDQRLWNPRPCLRDQVAEGLLYAPRRAKANTNTAKLLGAASLLFALIEILEENGLLSGEELDARKEEIVGSFAKRFTEDGVGVNLRDPQPDKYAFDKTNEIDCENCVRLRKTSRDHIPFALFNQDLEEEVIGWNLAEPCMIDQDQDGFRTHLDCCMQHCDVHDERPMLCRGYECRHYGRIWLEFDKRIPSPAVDRPSWVEIVSEAMARRVPA